MFVEYFLTLNYYFIIYLFNLETVVYQICKVTLIFNKLFYTGEYTTIYVCGFRSKFTKNI